MTIQQAWHPPAKVRGRIAALDGLRGSAAAAVVIAHCFGEAGHGLRALTFAWVGVGVFFVLSGYLIGSIVLDGIGKPGFAGRFVLRRAARILPVYGIVVLATFGALHLLNGQSYVDPPLPLWTYLTFTQNFAIPFMSEGSLWLLPTWTLAVEEQFYLVLPLVVALVPRRHLASALAFGFVGALAYRLTVFDHNPLAALTPLPARADLLLAGVAAALAERRCDVARHLQALRRGALAAIMLLLAACLVSIDLATILAPTLLAVGVACFILAITHGAPEGDRFSGSRLGALGALSYTLYLVHQPINGLLHGLILGARPDVGSVAGVGVTVFAIALSFAVASLSYRLVEAPILAWARRATMTHQARLVNGRA